MRGGDEPILTQTPSLSPSMHACRKPVKVVHLDVFISVRVSLTEHQHRAGRCRSCCDGEKSETGETKTFYSVIASSKQISVTT